MANSAAISFFHTGEPVGLAKSRLFRWKPVDILPSPLKKAISYEHSQKEQENILRSRLATHPYITSQAVELIKQRPDQELEHYSYLIAAGSGLEDYLFYPGEDVKNLIVERPGKLPVTKTELSSMAAGRSMGFMPWLFKRGCEILKKLGISAIDDPLNKPYMSHFLNPRKPEGRQGLYIRGGLRLTSAKERALKHWEEALKAYREGSLWKAYLILGLMAHLIQDICVPAHVHNDPHGPTLIFGKLDSLETYMAKPEIDAPAKVRLWNHTQAPQPDLKPGWRPGDFMDRIAFRTQMFRSVDGKGIKLDSVGIKYQFNRFKLEYKSWFDKYLDQEKKGSLSDEECYFQGCMLIPAAISYTAELLLQFRQFAENNSGSVHV